MFGGEKMENEKVLQFGDLYIYNCDRNDWTMITSKSRPTPRSGHYCVVVTNYLYLFGGEYTSPNQEKFKHFKDLWRLDLTSYEWDLLEIKGGPKARSGHRMVAYKHGFGLFGGFNDTGKDVKYFNDLWYFSGDNMKWRQLGITDSLSMWPSARSASQVAIYKDNIFIFGGYTKVKDSNDEDLEHGKCMDDIWMFDVLTEKWEKIKKAGMSPTSRAGSSMTLWSNKQRAIYFGGVKDVETKQGEAIVSEFFNDLYTFNLESRRWYPIILAPQKQAQSDIIAQSEVQQNSTNSKQQAINLQQNNGNEQQENIPKQDQEDLSKIQQAAVKIQSRYRGYVVRKAYKLYRIGGKLSEILYSPAQYGVDFSSANVVKPRPRINAGLVIIKNVLYLFGGVIEIGDQEVTLDDIWELNLAKLGGWNCIKDNTSGEDILIKQLKEITSSSSDSDQEDIEEE